MTRSMYERRRAGAAAAPAPGSRARLCGALTGFAATLPFVASIGGCQVLGAQQPDSTFAPPQMGSRARIEIVGTAPPLGGNGALRLIVSATRPETVLVEATFGGGLRPGTPARLRPEIGPRVAVAGVGSRVRLVGRIALTGEPESIQVNVAADRRGIAWVQLRARLARDSSREQTALTQMYFLFTASRTYYGREGVEHLQGLALADSLRRAGLPEAQVERRVRSFQRRASTVRVTVSLPPDTVPATDGDGGSTHSLLTMGSGDVKVEGRVVFADMSGATHPVRFAPVEVYENTGTVDVLLAATVTGNDGLYEILATTGGSVGSTVNLFVVVRAENDVVIVAGPSGEPYELSSESTDGCPGAPGCDVPVGATVTIDLKAGRDVWNENEVAFSPYEAMTYIALFLQTLLDPTDATPGQVQVRYPGWDAYGDADRSWYQPAYGRVHVARFDAHDWDPIQHEYGHFLQHFFGVPLPMGPDWESGVNLCEYYDGFEPNPKQAGTQVAWREAWPTAFALMSQAGITDAIPEVANTSYVDLDDTHYDDDPGNDTERSGYNLEPYTITSLGEGSPRALMRVLWDLYDANDDDGDVGVALGAGALLRLWLDGKPGTFSEFWAVLIAGRTEAEKAAYGAILATHKVGSEVSAPPDGTVVTAGSVPTLQWAGNMKCDLDGNAQYSVRLYNDALTTLLYASAFQASTTFDLTPVTDDVFGGPNGTLRWLVASRDLSSPATGVYYGTTFTLADNLDVAVRPAVDIILALDFSGSMGGVVPGSTTGLQKVELLKQAVDLFVATWSLHAVAGDRLGVVYFNSTTSTLATVPPFLVDMTANGASVIADLLGRMQIGCTAIGGALQLAYDSFDPTSDHKRVVILFTDGIQTANPFLIEDGDPPRLKVGTVAPGDTPPFGGFHCTATAALAPDGSPIVPDGVPLADHNVAVHTIGVGASGATFVELIERIASETSGLHHFTSAPDEELDLFFVNELVNSLQTASLQVVASARGVLVPGGSATLGIPVDSAATSLGVVLSWRSRRGTDTVELSVLQPNGAPAVPAASARKAFYHVRKFNLLELDPVLKGPDWTARLKSLPTADTIRYQWTAFVNEPCLKVRFAFPRRSYHAGEPITLTATVTHLMAPLANAVTWVDVTVPASSATNTLAAFLGALPADRARSPASTEALEPSGSRFHRAYQTAVSDGTLPGRVRSTRPVRVRLWDSGRREHGDRKAGDGIYSGILRATQTAGPYQLRFALAGGSACGQFTRRESTSLYVRPAAPSVEQSRVTAFPITAGLHLVRVRPADRHGNLWGPGRPGEIRVMANAGAEIGQLSDRLDGTYQQLIRIAPGSNPQVKVFVGDTGLTQTRVTDLVRTSVRDPALVLELDSIPLIQANPGDLVELPFRGRGFRSWPDVVFVPGGVTAEEVVVLDDNHLTVRARIASDAAAGHRQVVIMTDGVGVLADALAVLPSR